MHTRKVWWAVAFVALMMGAAAASAQDVADMTPPPAAGTDTTAASQHFTPSLTGTVLPSLTRIAVSLGVIVFIIYLTVFVLKKMSGGRIGGKKGTTIQIIEQTYLAPKKSVCLLKLADRAVLLGITEGGITLLTEMDWETLPPDVAAKVSTGQAGFSGFLNDAAAKLFGGKPGKGA